jgi:hypothetical protein
MRGHDQAPSGTQNKRGNQIRPGSTYPPAEATSKSILGITNMASAAYPPHYVRVYERPVIAAVVIAPAPIVVESAPIVVAPAPVVVASVVETIVRPVYPIYHHYWRR